MILFSIMASAIKGIVSKNKIRYKEDGFDLDLSYISKNIIAMGFPAETLERFYRNHIDDVVKFFDAKHANRYKIYNLCSESKRRYDVSKFHGPVDVEYSFQDHNPPPFEILKPFCENVHDWLKNDSDNVAGIHCKAGKGRTGVMICAYLVHAGGCEPEKGNYVPIKDADSALEFYGRHRTHDSKGVTIPSQKRYVYYYEDLVKRNLNYRFVTLKFSSILLSTVPMCNGGNYTLICEIYQVPNNQVTKKKIRSFDIDVKRGSKYVFHKLEDELSLTGDIKFEFYVKKIKKEKIFQFCLNTFFICYGTDTCTVASETCSKCNGDSISVLSNRNLSISKSSFADPSVIDTTFLKLFNNSRNENFRNCDCNNSSNLTELVLYSNSTAPHSSNDTGIHDPSSSLPSTSSLNRDNKLSISSTTASSSSSIQSLHRKTNYSDLTLNHTLKRDLYVVIPKDKIDKAYKDKSNKSFTSDFKVFLKFSSLGNETQITEHQFTEQCCMLDNTSSDTENYSEEEEDETSDFENNLERKSMYTFSSNSLLDNNKKGETTHL